MEVDPIADNQTNVVIAELMTRKDGDVTLCRAVAALLAQAQKQAKELLEIRSSLWSPDALDRRIDSRHALLCESCPARKHLEKIEEEREKEKTVPHWWQVLFSKDGLLIIVVLLFALMCMYMVLGQQGYHDVTTTLHTGGTK